MALLLNESEQIALLFEIEGRIPRDRDWVSARLAFQHYVEERNAFADWIEALVDVYAVELTSFSTELRVFTETPTPASVFSFEPISEPSFEIQVSRTPDTEDPAVIARVALDIKRVLKFTIPTAYRDNRICLQLRTTEVKFHSFSAQLLDEMARALG